MKILGFIVALAIATADLPPQIALAQAATTHTPQGGLAPAVLTKMLELNTASGRDGDMPAPIAAALGLTQTGQSWPDRQIAVASHDTGMVHALAVSRGADQDLILSVRGPVAISAFRMRRDGTLVSATDYFTATRQAAPLSSERSRAGFADECAFWSAHIESCWDRPET